MPQVFAHFLRQKFGLVEPLEYRCRQMKSVRAEQPDQAGDQAADGGLVQGGVGRAAQVQAVQKVVAADAQAENAAAPFVLQQHLAQVQHLVFFKNFGGFQCRHQQVAAGQSGGVAG